MAGLSSIEQAVAERCADAPMLDQVTAWAAINSGSRNLVGLAEMAGLLADAFAALPGEIELQEAAPVEAMAADGRLNPVEHGRNLHLRVRPEAPVQLLFTGHMDTVFGADHDFQTVFWRADGVLGGPGVADMKGGLAVMLAALQALETAANAASVGYDVLINSDEETGSLSSSGLIGELARGKAAALTYEPSALPDGTLAHARGGSGNYSVVVTGRAAHAGRNPQDGRNAIVAASALALELKAIEGPDITINPAKIDGGSSNNVVPALAVLRFNIRPKTAEAAERFLGQLRHLLDNLEADHEVSTALYGGITRPPKPVDPQAQKLFDLVRRSGTDLGQEIGWKPSGGVCDGNNIAATGVPVVDTMGVRGGAIHSPDEFMIVSSLAERAALSALVLQKLASGDPI